MDQTELGWCRELYYITGNLAEVSRHTGIRYGGISHAYKRDQYGLMDWDECGAAWRANNAARFRKRFEGKIVGCLTRALFTIGKRLDKDDIGTPTSLVCELQKLLQTYRLLVGEPTQNIQIDWKKAVDEFAAKPDDERTAIIDLLRSQVRESTN